MVNTDDFIKRIEIILDFYSLNASTFADKIGVQRSSISHLLSGRNKPSLDFVLKIMDVFPEVDLYWILNGKGSFPKSDVIRKVASVAPTQITSKAIAEPTAERQIDLFSDSAVIDKNNLKGDVSTIFSDSKKDFVTKADITIDRIVIFYSNGTFKTYSGE
jgi:DNA-binding XRE family transcriptional regulator